MNFLKKRLKAARDEVSTWPEWEQKCSSSSRSPAGYKAGTDVKHLETGNVYHVLAAPDDRSRLEYCDEPYYRYKDGNGVEWVRRQTEMEDGRFEAL